MKVQMNPLSTPNNWYYNYPKIGNSVHKQCFQNLIRYILWNKYNQSHLHYWTDWCKFILAPPSIFKRNSCCNTMGLNLELNKHWKSNFTAWIKKFVSKNSPKSVPPHYSHILPWSFAVSPIKRCSFPHLFKLWAWS